MGVVAKGSVTKWLTSTAIEDAFLTFPSVFRREELASQQEVRRSPRLSRRLTQLGDSNSHQLHITSRQSLSGYTSRRRPRSGSPSTVLNESGQDVPISFEDNEVDTETTLSHDCCESNDGIHDGIPSSFYGENAHPFLTPCNPL